jgi:ATP-dependent DNA helicase RecG
MSNSIQALLQRISFGEDSSLELKRVQFKGDKLVGPGRETLADEIAAFANGRGGTIVLGIDDKSREIMGIPLAHTNQVEALVREVCNDAIKPPIAPHIEIIALPTAMGTQVPVIRIDVDRSLFVHQSTSGYYHRVGSSKRSIPPDHLARLFQQRSQARLIRFDEQTIHGATLDDLDPALWQRFLTKRSDTQRESFLGKMAMARQDEEGTWRPSVAGVLLASKQPHQWLPNAFVQAVAYRGEVARPNSPGEAYQLDTADITGPLDTQIIDACRFVARNMKVAATKHIGRTDYPQFHLGAVFEAIVNAVAHRDYSMAGSKIRLRVFSNRLELYSPGALANSMDVASLPYRQAARNEAIVSLLARLPVPAEADWLRTGRSAMMDRRGEGVSLLLDESEDLSGRRPEFRMVDESELMLTIWAGSVPIESLV